MSVHKPVPRKKRLELREPLERAVTRALFNGYPVERLGSGRTFKYDFPTSCENPVPMEAFGSRSEYMRGVRKPITLLFNFRCRKCEACKRARSNMWELRAKAEYDRWPVTLFGTITCSMDQHYMLDARIHSGTKGEDGRFIRHPANINELSAKELFEARVRVFGDEVQKFLKRLRKGDKFHRPKIRYLLVAEAHDSANTDERLRGRPHFHILLHEMEAGSLVVGKPTAAAVSGADGEYVKSRYKSNGIYREGIFVHDDSFLRTQWHYGFTKFQFAENGKAASYLLKYLGKAMDARIRASQCYGQYDQ